ncbi:MAG: DUF2244 domain-containing protein [Sneathiella sp.]
MPERSMQEEAFSIVLRPHRSLSKAGFSLTMVLVGILSLIVGITFAILGAWPILIFFGLQFFLLFGAFKLNYRSGRRFETIKIENHKLIVSFFSVTGREIRKKYQAYWSRIEINENTLCVLCRNECLAIGAFLIDDEKAEVRDVVKAALFRYRNRVPFEAS